VLGAHLAGFSHAEVDALKRYLGRMIDNGNAKGENQQPTSGSRS
jgi:hypothetical protein